MVLIGEILMCMSCVGLSAYCSRSVALNCFARGQEMDRNIGNHVAEEDTNSMSRPLLNDNDSLIMTSNLPRISAIRQLSNQSNAPILSTSKLSWDEYIPISPRKRRLKRAWDSVKTASSTPLTVSSGGTDVDNVQDDEQEESDQEEWNTPTEFRQKSVLERDYQEFDDSEDSIFDSDAKLFYLERIRLQLQSEEDSI